MAVIIAFWSYRIRSQYDSVFFPPKSDQEAGHRIIVRKLVDYELGREIEQVWATKPWTTQVIMAPSQTFSVFEISKDARTRWPDLLCVCGVFIARKSMLATPFNPHYTDIEIVETVAYYYGFL